MKTKDIVIIGAGNPDIIKLIEDINEFGKDKYNILGYLEKDINAHGKYISGYKVLGNDNLLSELDSNISVVNNVLADPKTRNDITLMLKNKHPKLQFPSLIHPSNYLRTTKIGEGNIIYENVSLGGNVTIGNFNLIYYGSVIGHEAVIDDNILIAGNCIIGARTKVQKNSIISNGVTININLDIENNTFIGIGSVVIHSTKSGKKYFGNPAKEMTIKNMINLYKEKK